MNRVVTEVAVDQAVVDELINHIRNKTTDMADTEIEIPTWHFLDPERAAAERALLKKLPLIVAHASELPNPGDFITRDVCGMPLLIVRRSDGTITTYLNICAHRGGRVEQKAAGHKLAFTCMYHGWSYRRDSGEVRSIPFESTYGKIDRQSRALTRFKTEVRHGLIFVDFSNHPTRTIEEFIGPEVERELAPWNLEDCIVFLEKTYTLDINWKLVVDGAIDPVHPQFLHSKPGGVGSRVITNAAVFRAYGKHGKLFQPRSKLRELIESGAALDGSSKYIASIMLMYPNALFAGAPDHIEFWTVWPSLKDPGVCTIHIRLLVRKEILSPEIEARVRKSWEILEDAATTEDWPMEIRIQQNAAVRPDGKFLYGRNELAAQHLHRQLISDLGG